MSIVSDPRWSDVESELPRNDSLHLRGGGPRVGSNTPNRPRLVRRSGKRGEEKFDVPKINIPVNGRGVKEDDIVRPTDTSCVSLEHRRRAPCAKPLSPRIRKPRCPARGPEPLQEPPPCRKAEEESSKGGKKLDRKSRNSHRSGRCTTSDDVRVPCGVGVEAFGENSNRGRRKNGKFAALEKTMSKTQWYDEDGYHSAAVSVSQIYQPDSQTGGRKPCSSDKRRNMLRAKLRELVNETEPIPESCLLDSPESKPEPEILAEVLLMSEAEGVDLTEIKPGNVFDTLFADLTLNRSIAISSAAPESMSDMVVPVEAPGYEVSILDMPNTDTIIERTRTTAPPNLNSFQSSAVYESFTEHMAEVLERTPENQDISELLGDSRLKDTGYDADTTTDEAVDYVLKPGAPAHVNRVRLNGTVKPIWFPGYVLVSPAIPGCIRMTNDPGESLKEAWRLCQPRYFDDRSRYLVNVG